jgi:hypothetical protein
MIRIAALSFLVSLLCMPPDAPAAGADLTGVWTTDQAYCSKVFVRSGNRVSFVKDALLEGGGFIIEGKEIRGPTSACRIKQTKEEGAVTHMVAACSTEIIFSDAQFSVRIIDADTIARIFPSMPELDTRYYRCSI